MTGITITKSNGAIGHVAEPCERCESTWVQLVFVPVMRDDGRQERYRRALVWRLEFYCENGHIRLALPRVLAPNMKWRKYRGSTVSSR